jgi:hypothetical protein
MFDELQSVLQTEDIHLDRLLSFNWQHHAGKLRLRSLGQTHKAVVGGSPENGIVVQFLTHRDENCPQCRKRAKQYVEAIGPLVERKMLPGADRNDFTEEIVRKPVNKAERMELLAMRQNPKKRWYKIAPWLSQARCPECHGDGRPCKCIVMEDIL